MTKEAADQLIGVIFRTKFPINKDSIAKIVANHGVDIFFEQGSEEDRYTPFDAILRKSDKVLFDYVWSELGEDHAKILEYLDADEVDVVNALICDDNQDFFDHFLNKLSPEEKQLVFSRKFGPDKLTPLHHAILLQKNKIAESIVKEQLNVPYKDQYGFTTAQLMLLGNAYDPRLLIENGLILPDEIENTKKVANACAFLEYAYSNNGFYIRPDWVVQFYQELTKDNVEESDGKFLSALKIIDSGKLTKIGNQTIKVVRVPYKDHVAFAIIISNEQGVPTQLAYCDGYLPFANLTDDCGETRFFIKDFVDVEGCLSEITYEYPYSETVAEIFSDFVDQDVDGPRAVTGNIPTQKQETTRINCAFKSTNIAMRSIVQMMPPQLKYELDGESELRNDYKRFRKKAIDNAIAILEKTLCRVGAGKEYYRSDDYELALKYCRLSLEKSEEKMAVKQEESARQYEGARNLRLKEMLVKALIISERPAASLAASEARDFGATPQQRL